MNRPNPSTPAGSRRTTRRNMARPSALPLPIIRPLVAGIDIGSTEHWVAAPPQPDGQPNVRTFGTTTPQLEALAQWLIEQGVESVAMESTHVYWIPIYELLESRGLEVRLVNARQLRNVPGRKTDMLDCQWLQILHSCGLLRGSFRPSEAICALRALQRQVGNLVAQRTCAVQWMQQALDQMNVQVHRAVTDVTGMTGMAIIRAICNGERDPRKLAALRNGRVKKSEQQIAEHLMGNWREEHLFNLASALHLFDALEAMIATYDARILAELEALQPPERKEEALPPHPTATKQRGLSKRGDQAKRTALWRFSGADLTRIDGIGIGAAQTLLTEVGFDLSAFPTEDDFVSWLRLSPRVPISGGKPLRKKPNGMGAGRVAGVLRMAALSLSHSKSALGAEFRRTARRKTGAIAVFAVARKLAQLCYRMLRFGQDYVDIGEQAYEDRFRSRSIRRLHQTARDLGYDLIPAIA